MGTAQSGFLFVIYEPPKAAMVQFLIQPQLIYPLVFGLLMIDILFDFLFVLADRRHKVAAGPELLTNVVSFLASISSRDMNRALALDIADHLSNAVFRRNADYHVHVI